MEGDLIMEQQKCMILYSTSQNENIIFLMGQVFNNFQHLTIPLSYIQAKLITTSLIGLELQLASSQCVSWRKDDKAVNLQVQLRMNQRNLFGYMVVILLQFRWWYFLRDNLKIKTFLSLLLVTIIKLDRISTMFVISGGH